MDGFLEMVKIIALIVEIRNFNPNKTVMDKEASKCEIILMVVILIAIAVGLWFVI